MNSKHELRQMMRQNRKAMAAQGQAAGTTLILAAENLDVAAKIVSGYWPIGSEIDPRPLMQALADRGATLALPFILPSDSGGGEPRSGGRGDHSGGPLRPDKLATSPALQGRMKFCAFSFGDELIEGPMKIMQPLSAAAEVLPDILLVPLLAFDRRGYRLGYGGGYYDRALAFLRAQKKVMAIGLAFAGQKVDHVPTEPHDAPLDAILTEEGLSLYTPKV
jgi:5-formyltetrahydrofolate cyclo-ligase